MIQACMQEWIIAQDNYIVVFWQQSHYCLGGQLGTKTEGECAGEISSSQFSKLMFPSKVLQILLGLKPPCGG